MKRKVFCLFVVLVWIVSLAIPAQAAVDTDATLGYITDSAGLLSADEAAALEADAQNIAERYQCGIYIVTVNNFYDYGYSGDIYDAAQGIFEDYSLGVGVEDEGVLLLLSMDDRDYALICHGDKTHSVFTFDGQSFLENAFLDELAENAWNNGFQDYLYASETLLEADYNGTPMYPEEEGSVLSFVLGAYLVACLISGVICLIMKRQMKTANKRTTASEYIGKQGVQMRIATDRFTHATQIRRKIQTESSSGSSGSGSAPSPRGTPRSGGGYSGRSGKF